MTSACGRAGPGLARPHHSRDGPDGPSPTLLRAAYAAVRFRYPVAQIGCTSGYLTYPRGSLADSTLADWQRVIDADLTGTCLTVRAAARRMAPRGYGKLVTTGSLYSLRGDPLFGIHACTAAKSGVAGLTRSAAISLGRNGVRINAIIPGYTQTQIGGGALYADDPASVALRQKVTDRAPLGRVGQPQELKGLAVFLAAPAFDYCTGGVYSIDGGWLAT